MRELYQIFYKNNKFDTPDKLTTLEPYFYDIHNTPYTQIEPMKKQELVEEVKVEEVKVEEVKIEEVKVEEVKVEEVKVEEVKVEEVKVEEVKVEEVKENNKSYDKRRESKDKNMFEPKQKDTIFWCVFIYMYGYGEYTMVGSKYGNRELEEKQKMILFFKENPKILKTTNHKITNGNIQEIHSEYLSFQNETTLLGVIGLAVFYNVRILLVDASKKTYFDYHTPDTSKTCVLFKNAGIRGQTKYTFDMSMTDEKVQMIQNTMLCLEHYTKPLRAISTYSLPELEEIGKRIGVYDEQSNKKIKKQELYNKIAEYCGPF